MFKGKKTTTFYVGLVALGFALNYLSSLLYLAISTYVTYNNNPRLYTINPINPLTFLPQIIGVVIFSIIGLYIMSKGVEKEPTPSIGDMH